MNITKIEELNEAIANNSDKLVLLDFYAVWCGPCKIIGPILEEVVEEMKDKVILLKADVEEADELATEYKIRNVPTVLIYKNGEVVDKIVGALPKDKIIEKLNQFI